MVIGSGMIAKIFNHYLNNDDVVIFASGVSNSREEDDLLFEREKMMLLDVNSKNSDKKFVYFSTVSIEDESLAKSKYISHKVNIENIISKNFNNYIIFRLPNIIGNSKNKNTFFNFFKNKINNNEEIEIQKNAFRYIIDIEDVSKYLSPLIDSELKNKTINVCFNERIKMIDLIDMFEKIMNVNTKKKIIDVGYEYEVDNKEFLSLIKSSYKKNDCYIYQTIKKYIND